MHTRGEEQPTHNSEEQPTHTNVGESQLGSDTHDHGAANNTAHIGSSKLGHDGRRAANRTRRAQRLRKKGRRPCDTPRRTDAAPKQKRLGRQTRPNGDNGEAPTNGKGEGPNAI